MAQRAANSVRLEWGGGVSARGHLEAVWRVSVGHKPRKGNEHTNDYD